MRAPYPHRVVLEALTQQSDGVGGYQDTWATVMSLWANIQPLSEYVESRGGKEESQVKHRVRLRYHPDVKEHMRFRFRERVMTIETLKDPTERKRVLIADCVERTPS